MGSSLPPPATLDLVGSVARRDGSTIELVFARAEVPGGTGELSLTLTQKDVVVHAPAQTRSTPGGTDVVVRVPEQELGDGLWGLQLGRASADEPSQVTARLLVQGRRPVVLLWGQKSGKSRVPTAKRPPGLAGRIAAGGSKALDVGLRPLPDRQATRIRETARKVAKTVLH
jgi:hypothetical protein